MSRSQASQRQRLIGAATAVAARHGYGGSSVARIVAQAGVSRATFYEHFVDRDACVLAAYRQAAQPIEREVRRAMLSSVTLDSLREVLTALLADADRDPAATRLFLDEALAAAPDLRGEHERLLDSIEAGVEGRLADASAGSRSLEAPARALMGGVAGVVAIRVFRGEAGRLRELVDDLLAWIDAYARPGEKRLAQKEWLALGEGLSGQAPESLGDEVLSRRLPRGRGALPPSLVASEQRERVIAAVARLSREKGFTAMTVANIVATASITREVFYELFRDKEDAFLATQAYGLEQSVSLTAGRFFGEEEWANRVWNGLEAVLAYIAGQEDLVFVDLVESYAAGSGAIRRSFENRMAYTLFLEDGYRQRPQAESLPRLCSEAIASAIYELMRRQVTLGLSERMMEILPQAAYVTLAPFLGPAAALDLIEAKLARAAR